jgi:hypothetical protein
MQAPSAKSSLRHLRPISRATEVQRIRVRVERDGYPRLHMALLVLITGGAGFVASFLLLHAGLHQMWLRSTGMIYWLRRSRPTWLAQNDPEIRVLMKDPG